MILGLDVSTSIIGWSLLNDDGTLFDCGHIQMTQTKLKGNLFKKMDFFLQDRLFTVLNEHKDKIHTFGLEEAAKKFQGGKSTANTIFVCASFNFSVAFAVYKTLNLEPNYLPVTTARKTVGLKIPRGLDKNKKKSTVVEWCKPRFSTVKFDLGKTGNYKPWCFDVADSLVIAEAARRLYGSNSSHKIRSTQ